MRSSSAAAACSNRQSMSMRTWLSKYHSARRIAASAALAPPRARLALRAPGRRSATISTYAAAPAPPPLRLKPPLPLHLRRRRRTLAACSPGGGTLSQRSCTAAPPHHHTLSCPRSSYAPCAPRSGLLHPRALRAAAPAPPPLLLRSNSVKPPLPALETSSRGGCSPARALARGGGSSSGAVAPPSGGSSSSSDRSAAAVALTLALTLAWRWGRGAAWCAQRRRRLAHRKGEGATWVQRPAERWRGWLYGGAAVQLRGDRVGRACDEGAAPGCGLGVARVRQTR